jgi:hypothetical protein
MCPQLSEKEFDTLSMDVEQTKDLNMSNYLEICLKHVEGSTYRMYIRDLDIHPMYKLRSIFAIPNSATDTCSDVYTVTDEERVQKEFYTYDFDVENSSEVKVLACVTCIDENMHLLDIELSSIWDYNSSTKVFFLP